MISFLKKHWVLFLLAGVVIVGLLIYLGIGVFKSVKTYLSNHFGNPSEDQTITGGDTFHSNIFDATLNTIFGGNKTQDPTDRTRIDEAQGTFKAAEGDRTLSDIWDSPVGYLEFMLTGDQKYLM